MRHGTGAPHQRVTGYDAVNREAQITSVLILSFAVAFLGWAIVYLASAPIRPHKDDATRTQFRRWLAATTHRLLRARD
jgi:hypothetical protein